MGRFHLEVGVTVFTPVVAVVSEIKPIFFSLIDMVHRVLVKADCG